MTEPSAETRLLREFERQVAALVARDYLQAAHMKSAAFSKQVVSLRKKLRSLAPLSVPDANIPFVVATHPDFVPAEFALSRAERRGKTPTTMLTDDDFSLFEAIDGAEPPGSPIYLLIDIDIGSANRNVTPDDALATIVKADRSPLTIDEGIAVLTHFPEAVARNAGFSLAGSRGGDKRVPALWLSEGRPKLGWCWAGNPHTWLGTASCATRV